MHTCNMVTEVSKDLNTQMYMNLHAMKKKIGDLTDFPNISYEEFEIVTRTYETTVMYRGRVLKHVLVTSLC